MNLRQRAWATFLNYFVLQATVGLSAVLAFIGFSREQKPIEIQVLKLCNVAGTYSLSPDKS